MVVVVAVVAAAAAAVPVAAGRVRYEGVLCFNVDNIFSVYSSVFWRSKKTTVQCER